MKLNLGLHINSIDKRHVQGLDDRRRGGGTYVGVGTESGIQGLGDPGFIPYFSAANGISSTGLEWTDGGLTFTQDGAATAAALTIDTSSSGQRGIDVTVGDETGIIGRATGASAIGIAGEATGGGVAISGTDSSGSSGTAGKFVSLTGTGLRVIVSGSGLGQHMTVNGSSSGFFIEMTSGASTGNGLDVQSATRGQAAYFERDNASPLSNLPAVSITDRQGGEIALQVKHEGTGYGVFALLNQTGNSRDAVTGQTYGSGKGVFGSAINNGIGVEASCGGAGVALRAIASGSGPIAEFWKGTKIAEFKNSGLLSLLKGTEITGKFKLAVVAKNSNYTATADDCLIYVNTSTTAWTITLPSSASNPGQVLIIVDQSGNASNKNITISRAGTDDIVGNNSTIISWNYGSVMLTTSGNGSWNII